MKKQLFLSVVLLAASAEMFAPRGRPMTPPSSGQTPLPGGGGSRGGTTPTPTNGGGQPAPSSQGTSSAAAKAAEGLSAAEAAASVMQALGVTADQVAGVKADQTAVNFIKTGQA